MAHPDYRVLPGDIYQLGYSGGAYRIVVDASGLIRISNLGSVNTNGKTFLAVKKQVETLILQNYPLNAVQFVLVSPSNFTVTVRGEVSATTEIQAWGLTRVAQVLEGLRTDFASTRYLSITGISGKTTRYDLFKAARDAVRKSLVHSYEGRKDKKGDMRSIWITRINAAVRAEGLSYSKFINGVIKAGIIINRKALSNMAIEDPVAFKAIVELSKKAIGE